MFKITLNDIRDGINLTDTKGIHREIRNIPDGELLRRRFETLHFNKWQAVNIVNRVCEQQNLTVPREIVEVMPDDTVSSFLSTVNQYIEEYEKLQY